MNLRERAIGFVARRIEAKSFHAGCALKTEQDYYDQAEEEINDMTNVDFLDLLDTLLESSK